MADLPDRPDRLVWVAVLYVLASPIFALKAIGVALAKRRRNALIDSGYLKCRFCGHGNRLDVQVRCPRCSFVEPRSLALPCSNCGHVPSWIACAKCNASLRLP